MKHEQIINILLLVASAFLLVGVLRYFHLYEDIVFEGMESKVKEGIDCPTMPPPGSPPPPPAPPAAPPATTEPSPPTSITTYDF